MCTESGPTNDTTATGSLVPDDAPPVAAFGERPLNVTTHHDKCEATIFHKFAVCSRLASSHQYHQQRHHSSRGHASSGATMLDIFRGLKNLIKVSHISIDSPVFRLHYSLTVMMLMSFSLIVTTRQYVGNPIDCVHTKDIPEDVLNTYCWIHSTYALKSLFKKKIGSEVPYPGIGNSEGKSVDRKEYKYYQWVCFCLFFQVSKTTSATIQWRIVEPLKPRMNVGNMSWGLDWDEIGLRTDQVLDV